MTRLSNATVEALPERVERPGYDRAAVQTGVVHLGPGAFHRAHQAVVFDDLLRAGDPRWGVLGVSLRSADAAAQLNPQDGLYTVTERSPRGQHARVIGAVRKVLVAPEDPAAVVRAMADGAVQLVTLTITEKGYAAEPRDTLEQPVSAAAFIAAALSVRRVRGLPAFTALSCDNLPGNGQRLRAAVAAVAEAHDPALADWIGAHAAFPETMVDRIVPATRPADIEALEAATGLRDEAMVRTEPFLQWVIEDRFSAARPDVSTPGVQFTDAVGPWEDAKLRLLNGAHSAVAYLGGLAGIDHVHEFVATPDGLRFVEGLWDEAETTFRPPAELDLDAYRRALRARFANPTLAHRTRQIAVDGSQKLPQRLVAPLRVRLERRQSIDHLALAVAAWMRWQGGRDDRGEAFTVEDPLAATTARLLQGAPEPADQVRALLGLKTVFPPSLSADPRLVDRLILWLTVLTRQGAEAAIGVLAARR